MAGSHTQATGKTIWDYASQTLLNIRLALDFQSVPLELGVVPLLSGKRPSLEFSQTTLLALVTLGAALSSPLVVGACCTPMRLCYALQ